MNTNQRRPILKKSTNYQTEKQLPNEVQQHSQESKNTLKNVEVSPIPKNMNNRSFQNPESYSIQKIPSVFYIAKDSPCQQQQRSKTQQGLDLLTQHTFPRSPSNLNGHWDDSFKSILKSNLAYRRQLLSAYEEKVKIQTQKTAIHKELVNMEYQNHRLTAENKELEEKIAAMNKSMLKGKQNVRSNYKQLQMDINRLKHEASLHQIQKNQMNKAYEQVMSIVQIAQSKLENSIKEKMLFQTKNEQLKGEIAFILGKINECQQQNCNLQQKISHYKTNVQNLEIRLNLANEEISKLMAINNTSAEEINRLKSINDEKRLQENASIDPKAKQLEKAHARLKEANDQTMRLIKENLDLKRSIKSLKYLEQETINLRTLPANIEELNSHKQGLIRQNELIKKEKDYVQGLLRKQTSLLNLITTQYQELAKESTAKELLNREFYERSIQRITQQKNDLQKQLNMKYQENCLIMRQLKDRQKQNSQNILLIHTLQEQKQEQLSVIQKQIQQLKILKESLDENDWQNRQQKKQINNLKQLAKTGKQEQQYIMKTNKALLQEKEKCIASLIQSLEQAKKEKYDQQQMINLTAKRQQEKGQIKGNQIQQLKEMIRQLESKEKTFISQAQKMQESLLKKEQIISNLSSNILDLELASKELKKSINELQREHKQSKEKQSLINIAIKQREAIIESKTIKLQDYKTELDLLKKTHKRQSKERAQEYNKHTCEHYQKEEMIEEKYIKAETILKTVFKDFSVFARQATQLKNYDLRALQKFVSTCSPVQRYNLTRQIDKISQLISKISTISLKVERAVEMIKCFLPLKDINRNSIIISEGSILKVNKHYPS